MPAPRFTIEYEDGSSEEIKLQPKAQIAYESELGRSLRDDIESLTQMYELAWYAAGKPDGSLAKWVERVEAIAPADDGEADEDGETETRPTSRSKSRG